MTSVVPQGENVRAGFGALYEPVGAELVRVEELLRRELRSSDAYVDELVKHSFRLGGKRLRPALVLLAGKATGDIGRDHLVLAAVVEMIHTATLVHDDVLDGATMRRHLKTVNAHWNTEASVLLGDFLFSHSFYLASTLESTYACQTIGRSTNVVCGGELRQINSRGRFDMSEDEYLSIIDAKTAELCACCCRLGAHCSAAPPDVEESLARYGRHLGIAFQIADDLLDLEGDEVATGKSLGTDLQQQKPTLPLIHLWQQADDRQRTLLAELLSRPGPQSREALAGWLARFDGLDYARKKAEFFASRAREDLRGAGSGPARDALERLTELVVSRDG